MRTGSLVARAAPMIAAALALYGPATAADDPKRSTPGCGPRVVVEYTDDDPDYFLIENRSPEGWSLIALAIDLGPAVGALVFDTDEGGLGVGGAAPFFADFASPVRLVGTEPAADGGQTVALRFEEFTPGRSYGFNVDVDATPGGLGRTWVLPGDVEGARVLATFEGPSRQTDRIDAIFNDRAEADSGAGGCV